MSSLVHLPHRSLISLKGRDTFKYLQALTTNNLVQPKSQFTSFLNAQGRVLYDAFIHKTADSECFIETDSRNVQDLVSHLQRYKLRSKFELRVLPSDELGIYSLFHHASGEHPGALPTFKGDGMMMMMMEEDRRAPKFGYRVLSPTSPIDHFDLPALSPLSNYTRHRFRHAIAEGPEELRVGKALPMESNVDYMSGLDFHKGCYLGQELTVRTYHTGVVRKRIVPITLSSSSSTNQPPTETYETSEVEKRVYGEEEGQVSIPTDSGVKPRPAGKVLASIGDLGIGLMRLDKIGQTGYLKMNEGGQVGIVAHRPAHWPAKPDVF